MNLDLDDPLGDLLSDGSNDSLFGIEPTKKSIVPKVEKRDEKSGKTANKKIEQLFGIIEQPSATKSTKVDAKTDNLQSSPMRNPPKQQQQQKQLQPSRQEQLETKSNDSITSDLGFDPKKPKKKGNILDELLGISDTTTSSTKPQLPSKSSSKPPSISRQTTSETISENVTTAENPVRKSGGRRQSAVAFSDPLGLFGEKEKERGKPPQTTSKTSRKSIAGTEWLFADGRNMTGGSSSSLAPDKSGQFVKIKSSPSIQITANSEERQEDEPGSSNVTSLESKTTLSQQNVIKNQPQLMETLANEATNTLNNLKNKNFNLWLHHK